MPALTYSDEALIEQQVAEGKHCGEIARDLNVPHSIVWSYCKRAGLSPVKGRPGFAPRFSAEDRSEIVRRYCSGELVQAIAKSFGCASSTIYTELDRAGVARLPRQARTSTRKGSQ